MTKIRKKYWYIAGAILIFIVTAAGYQIVSNKSDVVATVNGSQIYEEEVMGEMEEMRSQILGEYPNAAKDPKIMKQWRKDALDKCVERKIILDLSKREGLIETTDYKELLQTMEKENQKRETMDEKGEIVYGILEYTKQSYFTYLISNLKPQLVTALREKELKFEEEEIKQFFEEKKYGEQIIQQYSSIIMYTGEQNEEVKKELTEIKELLDAGMAPEEVETGNSITKTDTRLSRGSRAAQRNTELSEAIFALKEGEAGEIAEDQGQYHLTYCIEKFPEHQLTYEEGKTDVEKQYLEEKLNELVFTLKSKAKVIVNTRKLQKISL